MLDRETTRAATLMGEKKHLGGADPWREGIDFRILWARLRSAWGSVFTQVLALSLSGLLAGFGYGYSRTPVFSAESAILVSNTTLQLSGPDAVLTQVLVENSLILSQIEVAKSDRVMERAIASLGPAAVNAMLPGPRFLSRVLALVKPMQLSTDEERARSTIDALKANVQVKRVGGSQLISIRARANTADAAAQLANAVAVAFVREDSEANALVTTSAELRERIKVLGPTVRVIDAATPPSVLDGPGQMTLLALGALGGAGLGLGLGLLRAVMDRRVRCAEQWEQISPTECLGFAPKLTSWQARWRILGPTTKARDRTSPRFALLEDALRRICIAASESLDRRPRILGVTTVEPGEGATFIAVGLARLLAADGERVLLIDAVFDNPDLSRAVELDDVGRPRQALRDPKLIAGAIHNIELQLDFLPAGKVGATVNARWQDLAYVVGEPARDYDWVIVDLSPLARVVDVRRACQFIDRLLLVLEWGSTPQSAVEHALRALGPSREKLLGLVFNKAPRRVLPKPRSSLRPAARSDSRLRPMADTTSWTRTSP